MSCNYADGLSPYEYKGVLGQEEKFDTPEELDKKIDLLCEWLNEAKHAIAHTGAGISTSAGIPDFRGPKGVWTLEEKGEKPSINISFDEAIPTKTHMALYKLVNTGKIKYVVSQNIDGLHIKSGLSRDYLSELHGNMFLEQCLTCDKQFIRNSATTSVGQKCLEIPCKGLNGRGVQCRAKLHDTILDWEHNLPEDDLSMAHLNCQISDLSICLGTTLQIKPSGTLPLKTKKKGGKLVIVNLQPTQYDRKAHLIINAYVDDVFERLMKKLGIEIPEYDRGCDPTKKEETIVWQLSEPVLKRKALLRKKKKEIVKTLRENREAEEKLVKEKLANEIKKKHKQWWKGKRGKNNAVKNKIKNEVKIEPDTVLNEVIEENLVEQKNEVVVEIKEQVKSEPDFY